jgi:two-component system nitrate/nitrite response regulator NarL
MDTTIIIASDVRLYCEGLGRVLDDQNGMSVMGMVVDPEGLLQKVVDFLPDLVLMDTTMPLALMTVRRVREITPNVTVVALGVSDTMAEVCRCAEAGVAGFVSRDASLETLLKTIRSSINGDLSCSPHAAGFLLRQVSALANRDAELDLIDCLTYRQRTVLEQIGAGKSNKEIARNLNIELSTVKNHVHQILEKLNVRRRGEAAALWTNRRNSSFTNSSRECRGSP